MKVVLVEGFKVSRFKVSRLIGLRLAGWDHKQAPLTSNQQPTNLPEGNAKGEQPWPIGHACAFNLLTFNLQPNNLKTFNLGLLATLREQTFNLQPTLTQHLL
ncbi:MAG: hypothetical protein F6K65_21560 [Moorea sp. SIO3C2]|nr:hypothetical protein [Moorena sp. SIO3C2]